MKSKLIAVALCATFALQSCATLFSGNTAKINVSNGNPPNAKVYVDGKYTNDAPTTVKVPKRALKDGVEITVKADGKEQTTKVHRKVQAGWLILDILTGGIWVIVDFATGNIYKATPSTVDYNVTKQ